MRSSVLVPAAVPVGDGERLPADAARPGLAVPTGAMDPPTPTGEATAVDRGLPDAATLDVARGVVAGTGEEVGIGVGRGVGVGAVVGLGVGVGTSIRTGMTARETAARVSVVPGNAKATPRVDGDAAGWKARSWCRRARCRRSCADTSWLRAPAQLNLDLALAFPVRTRDGHDVATRKDPSVATPPVQSKVAAWAARR